MGVLFQQILANATSMNIVNDDVHKLICWRDFLGSATLDCLRYFQEKKRAMVQESYCEQLKLLLRHSLWKEDFHTAVPKRVRQIVQAFSGRLLSLIWGEYIHCSANNTCVCKRRFEMMFPLPSV